MLDFLKIEDLPKEILDRLYIHKMSQAVKDELVLYYNVFYYLKNPKKSNLSASDILSVGNAEIRHTLLAQLGGSTFLVERGEYTEESEVTPYGQIISIKATIEEDKPDEKFYFLRVINSTPDPDGEFTYDELHPVEKKSVSKALNDFRLVLQEAKASGFTDEELGDFGDISDITKLRFKQYMLKLPRKMTPKEAAKFHGSVKSNQTYKIEREC